MIYDLDVNGRVHDLEHAFLQVLQGYDADPGQDAMTVSCSDLEARLGRIFCVLPFSQLSLPPAVSFNFEDSELLLECISQVYTYLYTLMMHIVYEKESVT